MGYSNFLFLKEELSLIAVMLILLVYIPPKASAVPAGKRFSSVWARNNTQATG